jgi:hypothetical protein
MARSRGIVFTPRVRWIGRQYRRRRKQLILGEWVIADIAVSHPLSRHLEIFLSAENLRDTRVETGRTADGIVNIGTPRLVVGGLPRDVVSDWPMPTR